MAALSVIAILQFYQKSKSRIDARVQAILNEYARAESEILANVLAGLAAEKVMSLRERRRREALARQILRVVDAQAAKRVPVVVNQSFQLGQHLAERSTGFTFQGLSRTNRDAMQVLTENLIGDLHAATDTVGRRVEDIFRKETLKSALENVPGERPEGFVSDELKRTLKREGVTAFYDRTGRTWTLENYSKMAVKTVTNEGVNIAQASIFADRGIDLVEINRSKNPCVECLEFNGNTYSLTGRATGYEVLKRRPPFHPGCEHFMFASPLALKERRESGWVDTAGTTVEEGVAA